MKVKDKELHRIAATAIIYKPDFTYLIIRRGMHKIHPGRWLVPGGGLSIDDYMHERAGVDGQWNRAVEKALHREIKEETGLKIGKPEYLRDIAFITPKGIPVLVLSFFAPHISGEVELGIDEDVIDFAWVTLAQAKKYDLVGETLDELKDADTILKSRKKK